jgi:hypothetical protein
MTLVPNQAEKQRLLAIHEARLRAHWGKKYDVSKAPWPKSDADWRQVGHGAPFDTNVIMARWHLDFVRTLQKEGLLE